MLHLRHAAGPWLAGLVFVGSFLWRLAKAEFHNDHFFPMAGGRQILAGELPWRDFFEEGRPLQFMLSAAMLAVSGETLLGEALLSIALLSLGAALVFLLALHASKCLPLALAAAAIIVVADLRLYSYPKLAFPMLTLALAWRYADRPSPGWLAALGFICGVSGLMRLDLGLMAAVAASVLVAARHWPDGWPTIVRRGAILAGAAALTCSPYILFVEANGGLTAYALEGVGAFRSAQSRRPTITAGGRLRPHFDFDTTLPLIRVSEAQPLPPVGVSVRWSPHVVDSRRLGLEQRYRLSPVEPIGERSWKYLLGDPSSANLEALVGDPAVEDTHGVDRRRFRPTERPNESVLATLRRESPLLRLDILPGLQHVQNSVSWLYYLAYVGPGLVVLSLVWLRVRPDRSKAPLCHEGPKLLAVAALTSVAAPVLLQSPYETRVVEPLGPALVMGAWLIGRWLGVRPGSGQLIAAARLGLAGALVGVTWSSVAHLTGFERQLEVRSVLEGPAAMAGAFERTVERLTISPPIDGWASDDAPGGRALTRWVYECTRPDDRLLIASFAPEIFFFGERLFAGGYPYLGLAYWSSDAAQRRGIERLEAQSVPILLGGELGLRLVARNHPILNEYLMGRFERVPPASLPAHVHNQWIVMIDRAAVPLRTYEPLGLPCFTPDSPNG